MGAQYPEEDVSDATKTLATPFSSRRPFYQSRAPSPQPMAHSPPSTSTNTLTNHSTYHHRPPTTTFQHLPLHTTTSSHLHRPPTTTCQHPPPTTTSIHLPSPTTFTTSSHLPSPTTHIPPPTPPPPPRTTALLAPPAPSRRRLQRLLGSDGLAMHGRLQRAITPTSKLPTTAAIQRTWTVTRS